VKSDRRKATGGEGKRVGALLPEGTGGETSEEERAGEGDGLMRRYCGAIVSAIGAVVLVSSGIGPSVVFAADVVEKYGRGDRTTETLLRDGTKESTKEKKMAADSVVDLPGEEKKRLEKTVLATPPKVEAKVVFRRFTDKEKETPVPNPDRYVALPDWVDILNLS
jgi:hypothetical protein